MGTAACPVKTFFKSCTFCGQVGHTEKMCPERRKQAVARHAEWVERQKQVAPSRARKAEWIPRNAQRLSNSAVKAQSCGVGERSRDDCEVKSTTSELSTSTAATSTQWTLVLTEQETREARKYAKLLREIDVIDDNISRGEKVDKKQMEKAQRRTEIEDTLVMKKVRAGYSYFTG